MYYKLKAIDWCAISKYFYIMEYDFEDCWNKGHKVMYVPFVAKCPSCYSYRSIADKLYPVKIESN